MKLVATVPLALLLAGCATTAGSKLAYTSSVRLQSYADNRLFKDLLSAIGGVGFADQVQYPNVTERRLVKIEVIIPYDNRVTGIENWTVEHNGRGVTVYTVKFMPDGQGGTYYAVAAKE